MRKVNNPFIDSTSGYSGYRCFACCPTNKSGLKMEFHTDEDSVWCEWQPKIEYDGWIGVVHGGIQATLMDETAEWFICVKHGRTAVTMELNCKYKKPLNSEKGKIKIIAKEIAIKRNIAEIQVSIYDNDNVLCTEAIGKFFMFSEEESKEKYSFPGKDKF